MYIAKVKKFIESLDDVLAFRVARSIDSLERYGNLLGLPVSKAMGKGLFELRITGDNHIRIFYCFHNNNAVILHAIFKQHHSIPKREIEYARKTIKELR